MVRLFFLVTKDGSCENLKSACENLLRIRQFSLRLAATWRSRGGLGKSNIFS